MRIPRITVFLGLLYVVLCVVSRSPQAAAAEPEWIRIQSPHFELFTTVGEGRGRDAIVYFERLRNFFITATNSKLPQRRVTLIAFNSPKEFEPYRRNEFSEAFYLGGHSRDYIVMGRINDQVRRIAAHEYVHLLVRHSGVDLPLWLNEGLAELYSTLKPTGKKVLVGEVIPSRLLYLRQKTMLPLAELTGVTHSSSHYNERDRAGVFYSQSWALTHMLNLSDSYREGSSEFLMQIANGTPSPDAFQRVYAKSLEEIYKDLRGYVHGDYFKAALFDIKLEKSDENIETTPAAGLETGLLLGELLAYRQKTDQARKVYEETLQAYPQAPSVREALGYLSLRDRDREQAKRFFAEAVELHSTNSKLYHDYALLLREDGVANAEVIPLLERAVQLDDDLQETRLYLGYLLMDEGQYGKAVVAFAGLKRVTREQAVRLYRARSYAYYRMGNKENAQKFLDLARKYAESPDEIDSVEKMADVLSWQGPEAMALASGGYTADPGETGAPRLERAPATDADTTTFRTSRRDAATVTLTGILEKLECSGGTAKVKIAVGADLKALAISDPGEILVTGVDAGAFEFTCGPQNSRPLTIEYEPREDAAAGTIGEVRVIHLE
jgi:tetratricopeptide (TPR) repeat protein